VIPLDDQSRPRKRTIHIFTFTVDGWIDLVRHGTCFTLVSLESDIVRSGYAPQWPPIDRVRRLPDAQVIP
jgi:hypothetical protein